MRNLKRALSLTLASVMLLGMMVLGTSAASYPDVTDEHNVEAIEVLQAIGVMSGSNSGNFNPDSKVTRIEMAIVMANLLNLDVNYFQGQNQFSDVPEWASGYVNACAANGIVTGVGGGRFGTGNVTATQAALMMLKALGYFQFNSDFKGDWARSTALQASKIRLFEGITAQDNTQLTRNQVAQLALNALEADMVDPQDNTLSINTGESAGNISITGGQVTYVVRTNDAPFASAINDTVSGGSIDGRSGTIVQLGEQLYNGNLKLEEDDDDDFGRPARTWTYKNDSIGTYAKKADRVGSFTGRVNRSDIYGLLSGTVRSDLAADPSRLTIWVDGAATAGTSATLANWYGRNDGNAIYTIADPDPDNDNQKSTRKGTVTEVFVSTVPATRNNDEYRTVDIVISNTFVYQATSDYSASRNDVRMSAVADTAATLSNQTMNVPNDQLTLKGEDFEIENIKNKDYLLVTLSNKGMTSNNYAVKSVDVAKMVQGNVDGWTVNDSVTIDGTKYSYSATARRSGIQSTQYAVGQPAIVVLDKYDNIIAVDEAVASSNFVFIEKFAHATSLGTSAVAQAYFADGTQKGIDVYSAPKTLTSSETTKNGTEIGGFNADHIGWYTYSINGDGQYVLYAVPSRYVAGDTTTRANNKLVDNGQVNFLPGDPDALANDKTIMIAIDKDGDVGAYTGTKAIPDITVTDGTKNPKVYYLMNNVTKYVEYAFVSVKGIELSTLVGGDENSALIYVLRSGDEMRGPNATTVFTYSAIDDENNAVYSPALKFDTKLFSGDPYDLYYKSRTNSDGEIISMNKVSDDAADANRYFSVTMNNATANEGDGALTFSVNNAADITDRQGIVGTSTSQSFTVNENSKIVLVALKGTTPQTDKSQNHEITYNINPTTLVSLLKGPNNLRFNARMAGTTVSSTSTVIDTMYITVTGTPAGQNPDPVGPGGTSEVVRNALAKFDNDSTPTTVAFLVSGGAAPTRSEKLRLVEAAVAKIETAATEIKAEWNSSVAGQIDITVDGTNWANVTESGSAAVAAGKPTPAKQYDLLKDSKDNGSDADKAYMNTVSGNGKTYFENYVDLAKSGFVSNNAEFETTGANAVTIKNLTWKNITDKVPCFGGDQPDGGKTIAQMYPAMCADGKATKYAIICVESGDDLTYKIVGKGDDGKFYQASDGTEISGGTWTSDGVTYTFTAS